MKLLLKNKNIVFYIVLALIMFTGLYYRIFFALNIHFTDLHNGSQFGHDEYNYCVMAENIVEKCVYGYLTDGEPNAYVTPGYPIFLSLIYALSSENFIIYAKIIQAFLSTVSIWLVFLIGKRVANKYVGIIAAFFVALYPPIILYSRHILTETLYIFFFLLYFLVQLSALQRDKWGWDFAAGVMAAAAILVRPLIFILLPLPYIYKYFTQKRRGTFVNFGVFMLGFGVLMMPWWIRNIMTMGRFIFMCTQSNPFYYGIAENHYTLPASDNEFIDGINLILHNLKTAPLETIKWYTIDKLNIIFNHQDYMLPEGLRVLTSIFFLHYVIIVTGALGMAMFKGKIRLITVFIILNTGIQLLFIPTPRYAVPLIPLISICGAYMLWYLFSQCKSLPPTHKGL